MSKTPQPSRSNYVGIFILVVLAALAGLGFCSTQKSAPAPGRSPIPVVSIK